MNKPRTGSLTRREFLLETGTGLAVGGPATWGAVELYHQYSQRRQQQPLDDQAREQAWHARTFRRKQFTGTCVEVKNPPHALPGPFPGRVVEVQHPGSVVNGEPQLAAVRQMMDRGMMALTAAPDAVQAWQRLFKKGERVGIKVNPVGFSRTPGVVGCISSFAVIVAVIEGLKSAGLSHKDIILFERYAVEFRGAGYDRFVERELPGVRWYAAAATGGNRQIDLEGRDADDRGRRPEPDPHVIGYDRDIYRTLDYTMPEYRASDPLSYQSHVSRVLTDTKQVDVQKIITIPLIKDHRSAGITVALKNLSHGMASNVARTHSGQARHENQCATFIPHIVALPPFRDKVVLHIADGLIGVYEGGPGSWNATWGTWEPRSLFFATDPVALDHVAWDLLDTERVRRGWAPVGEMGLAGSNPARHKPGGGEQFHFRQPEHVEIAASLDLGLFDPSRIEHRQIVLTA